MTYNVNYGLAGDPSIVAAILEGNADVVFLQETNEEWERYLRRTPTLCRRYPQMEFQHSPSRKGGGQAVLSSAHVPFEVREISPSPFPRGMFACRTVLNLNPDPEYGEQAQVLNVHLHPAFINGRLTDLFHTRRWRKREIEHHIQLLEPELHRVPTFVVGDFNEGDSGLAIRFLANRCLRSSLSARLDRKSPTWRWKVGPFTLRHRLDHIVYDTRAWNIRTARVVAAGESDHLPVVASFRRRRTPSAI